MILCYQLCPLDGAKKPWDRANSADRSMGSRWELQAAQLVADQQRALPVKSSWFCVFFIQSATWWWQYRLRIVRPRQDEAGNIKKKTKRCMPVAIYWHIFSWDFFTVGNIWLVVSWYGHFMFLQEILEEVFRELHKVRDEIIDGMFTLVQMIILNQSDHFKRKSRLEPLSHTGYVQCWPLDGTF